MTTTLFVNARVYDGVSPTPVGEAFVSTQGRITWCGTTDERPNLGGLEQVDLGGRTVLPGFIDAHTHLSFVGEVAHGVACTIPTVTSMPSMVDALRASPARGAGDDVWIDGWGWDESKLAEHRAPTRHDLDQVSTSQPVFVLRSDAHSASCNTRALELAQVTAATPDPPGAAFGRDADGTPDGRLIELAAKERVQRAKTPLTFETFVDRVIAAGTHYASRGIVACSEMMALTSPFDQLDAFRAAAERGFPCQVNVFWHGPDALAAGCPPLPESRKRGRVKLAGLKAFLDGTVSGRTAWLRTPDALGGCGVQVMSDAEVTTLLGYARREGLQLAVHAMGDRAIERLIELAGDLEPWLEDRPSVRIEHATLADPDLLARLAASRMRWGVATQVIFGFAEIESYTEHLTPAQVERCYPVRALQHTLDAVALSSDAPATTWADPDDVFVSWQAAVTRRAHDGTTFGADQAVTAYEALGLYTARAAALTPYDTPVGRLAPGFSADFVVVDADPLTGPPTGIAATQVWQTWVGGELVWSRDQQSSVFG